MVAGPSRPACGAVISGALADDEGWVGHDGRYKLGRVAMKLRLACMPARFGGCLPSDGGGKLDRSASVSEQCRDR